MIDHKLGLVQRVLPIYRAPFFDALASNCREGLSVLAGQPRKQESIASAQQLNVALWTKANNLHILSGPAYLCYQRGLVDWLDQWAPGALIVEANPRYISTPVAVKWMRKRDAPVLGWGLGSPPPPGLLSALRRDQRLKFLSQFDALISYSARGAEQYAALGFPAQKVFVAPNATAGKPKYPLPARDPKKGKELTLLYVGRLQARKRLDDLIRACASLQANPRLVIVGDGPERSDLESLARQIYPRTEFTGAKFGPELAGYFTQADVFVLPGTGGLAVQEAMSYGLPVVVARGDGTQDDLVRPSNGWQIAPDDPAALLSALDSALADIPRLRAMGAESYRIVAEEVNIEKMVQVFEQAINSVL
jgi:glycosyltransferase involved in cell wall biosynthesis